VSIIENNKVLLIIYGISVEDILAVDEKNHSIIH